MGKADKPRNGGGMVADSRFAAVHYDPRFQRFPKAKSQVEIDERFAGIFKDEAFQVSSTVDKRGRRVKRGKKMEDMHRYYRLKEERQAGAEGISKQTACVTQQGRVQGRKGEASTGGKAKQVAPNAKHACSGLDAKEGDHGQAARMDSSYSSVESSDAGSDVDEQAAEERWARMRGLAGPDTSSEEDDEDPHTSDEEIEGASQSSEEEGVQDPRQQLRSADEDEPLNEADLEEWGVGALAANPEEPIPLLPDATARLAAVDLDWEHVRAVDILAVMRSFVPKDGSILSVVVYPSDYGLERMGREAVLGPQGIFISAHGAASRKNGEQDEEGGGSGSDSEEGGEVDQRRLRLYERSKLRYFYAIITCDSAATANRLYEECDGMELMKTACKFDLRFVPREQSFKGRHVRDEALDVPADYAPPAFQARALQHTSVQLTWDADDDTRRRALTRRLNADELKEDDFRAYLASESEEEDGEEDGGAGPEEDEEAIRQRYRMLLADGAPNTAQERHGKKDWVADDDEEGSAGRSGSDSEAQQEAGTTRVKGDKGMEMEVTFIPGLENLGERLLARKRDKEARKGETVWDAYMRRKREKRAEAKRQGRHFVSDESDSDGATGAGAGSEEEELPAGVAGDPFFQGEGDPFDDPFFRDAPGGDAPEEAERVQSKRVKGRKGVAGEKDGGKKGKRKEAEAAEDAGRRAELEMLLLDDATLMASARGVGSGEAHVPPGQSQQQQAANKLSKKERMRLKKDARRRERQEGSDDEDAAAGHSGAFAGVNLSDPRFAELLTSHHFALDPTDPRFKETSASVAAEVAKRRSIVLAFSSKRQQQQQEQQQQQQQDSRSNQHNGSVAAGKADLKLLVASLKRKSAAAPDRQARPMAATDNGGKPKKKRT